MTDTERIDWLIKARATTYQSEFNSHWVVVDEMRLPRKGCVENSLREAIDKAMAESKPHK